MTNIQAIDLLKGLEQSLDDYCELNDEGKTAFRMAITALELFENSEQLPSSQPEKQHGRIFQEIVVEYLSYNTYPEYKGKPYFSIKYTEKGQEFIGYGTYKPEVLSEYLKEYFMPSAQPERKRGRWLRHEDEDGEHYGDKCSECGEWYVMPYGKTNYCPNCGAKMEED